MSLKPSINKSLSVENIQLWTALVTPFLPNGDIDFNNVIKLAKQQEAAGNGITLLGSTGEGLALTTDEQYQLVKRVTDLQLKVPIMVTVGGYNLPQQLQWLEQCNELAIDAYLLASPLYAKPGSVGLTQWFLSLLEKAKFPCMIYNVPSRSGVDIPVDVMVNIQAHKNCWAMKEASGQLNTFLAFRQHCPDLAMFSGEDAMMPYLANAGVKGLVSVAANVWPQATHQYVQLSLAGQCQSVFPVWKNAIEALFQVSSPIPLKVLMHLNKQLNYPRLRAPLTSLEISEDPYALKILMQVDQEINQWLLHQPQST